ncbi:MAG: selenocysteine-specific translation elongation factor [Gemmatimonadaceae bacterium]
MIIGTAGHIDHGKTTLVRALTGVDTDRLPEEKRRGITIELGFAPLELPGLGIVGVVDVPGHEGFVRTMLAGATGIDVGLLVVAADEGVMPQTREHLSILNLLAVRAAVVALTKCDVADEEWLALVRDDVAALVAGTPFANAPIVETSARSGQGIDELKTALVETLSTLPDRDRGDLFRLPIDRAFTVKGTGTVVTGTVWSGSATHETPLRLFPANRPVRVRGLQAHGSSLSAVSSGMRAAIALAGVDLADVSRGAMLVEEGGWEPSRVLRGEVALLDGVDRALRPREWVRLHLGTIEVGVRVVAQGGALNAGERRGARLVLDEDIVVRAGDRFVIRRASPAETIGGGIVVDPSPPRRRARPWASGLALQERLQLLVAEGSREGISAQALPVRLGVRPIDVAPLLSGSQFVRLDGRLFPLIELETGVVNAVARLNAFHADSPLEERLPLSAMRAALSLPVALADAVLAEASKRGLLDLGHGGAKRPDWSPQLDEHAVSWVNRLKDRLGQASFEPPSVSELRMESGGNDPVPFLRILEREGLVVQVEVDRFYAASAFQSLVQRLREGMEREKVYSPSELRELLGISRKYLIPLLEHCDRQRITERREQGRVIG